MMTRQSLRAEHIALLVGAGGTCLFLGALGFQYIGGIPPCEMCHWQRWAHIGAAITGILAATVVKGTPTARGMAWFAILFVLTSGLIGAYQTGMEYHLLPGPAAAAPMVSSLSIVRACSPCCWQRAWILVPAEPWPTTSWFPPANCRRWN